MVRAFPGAVRDRRRRTDYVHRQVPMLFRMYEKRMRGYQAMGYRRESHPVS